MVMVANWWLALIIMVVLNGILVWTLLVGSEPLSRRAKKWFFIVVNAIGLILAISQFFWMDF
ncbi:hypothetical protein A7975_31620 [Bacillus sp. FJAT-26390]|nr:hypothetical protein A7975_31620 [Bacillus sp. FJAT-26390]